VPEGADVIQLDVNVAAKLGAKLFSLAALNLVADLPAAQVVIITKNEDETWMMSDGVEGVSKDWSDGMERLVLSLSNAERNEVHNLLATLNRYF
jgi:hypothetical protein